MDVPNLLKLYYRAEIDLIEFNSMLRAADDFILSDHQSLAGSQDV